VTFPKISVITPSFNQAHFLERTIRSVLDQGYPNLEYIIIDGGSTDGSVDIIRRYANRLAYWVSESDRGQAHAINKGLAQATGEWVGWQNSDDVYYPEAFQQLTERASVEPDAQLIIGNMNLIDKQDVLLRDIKYVKPTYAALIAEGMVLANQATFWRHKIHTELGFLDETLDCGFDYEWFLRVLKNGREAAHVNTTWGGLRLHAETKTSNRQQTFVDEFEKILKGREASRWNKKYHQMRRFLLMLKNGEFRYISRGMVNRLLRVK
jgi:glycosyltransferase involved in cell wall biosynthesis